MRRALRRSAVSSGARNVTKPHTFVPPTRGWIQNENIVMPKGAGACRLENFFPTSQGARVRAGSYKYQKVSDGTVYSIWAYKSGSAESFFAADETNVFDISSVSDADVAPSPIITGQSAGYYSTTQFGTSGGDFLLAVNGADVMWQFNGTNWFPVNGEDIREIDFTGGTGIPLTHGQTITGGTSGASAVVVAVIGVGTAGTMYLGPVTGGPFVDGEALTSSLGGATTADGADASYSSIKITGVDTSSFSQAWSFANRLFFVEKDTMKSWYLPVDSIGGAASTFSLAGVFRKGGSLLFGATWSLDAGDGLDDKCVFVSTEGEVAVYQGTNPGDANNWAKVGVYNIGKPLGLKGHIQAGGDLLIATDAGLVSLTQAITKDVGALSATGITRPIFPAWGASVQEIGSVHWELLKWTEKSMLVVSQPRPSTAYEPTCLVANMETGGWGKYLNWDTRCLALFEGRGFFGALDGNVYEMERGGSDNGLPYTCVYVGQFDHLKKPGVHKSAMQARAVFAASGAFGYQLSVSTDYNVELPAAPNAAADYVVSTWDSGLWDTAIWDGTSKYVTATQWASLGKTGFVHAPQIQITIGTTVTPDIELISYSMTYAVGGVVV